jgi:DNA topoisomerase-1
LARSISGSKGGGGRKPARGAKAATKKPAAKKSAAKKPAAKKKD